VVTSKTDVLKESVLRAFQAQQFSSWPMVLFSLMMAFAVGMFIFWVYTKTFRGVMYSQNFGITLVLMTLITTPVVMCIKSSISLSMGMVGALSIVRFRTAVKDPLDTAYMFWALTMGILLGAGQFFLACLTVIGIAGLVFLINKLNFKTVNSYLLVVHYDPSIEQALQAVLRGIRNQQLKSKTASREGAELTLEIRLDRTDLLLNRLLSMDGVADATVVAYQTDSL